MRDSNSIGSSKGDPFRQFTTSIYDVVDMLSARSADRSLRGTTRTEPLPSLLEQCRKLSEEVRQAHPEPIRTIHHFACTGGTLISKCIASLPNTQLLSEVDPLSLMGHESIKRFSPTDLVTLLQASSRPVTNDLLINVFLGGLHAVYKRTTADGVRLVLRDHAHSHFCFGEDIQNRPSLRQIVGEDFEVKSVVTVRHPLDSYLSLLSNGWHLYFKPSTLEEYCRRYHCFLDHYSNIDLYQYEDFVADPEGVLKNITDSLELSFDRNFQEVFSVHRLTGDSGRSGDAISIRMRRDIPENLGVELKQSSSYKSLCARLKYNPTD